MTLEELLIYDLTGLDILILGKPSAGKTWLSKVLEGMYKHHTVLHADDYLTSSVIEPRLIAAIIEDQSFTQPCIIEGMSGYQLLLTGAKDKNYSPDVVIEIEISAGKQREIYLAERNPSKIQFLKRFAIKMQGILNEYHQLVPEEQKPLWIKFENNYVTKVKDI